MQTIFGPNTTLHTGRKGLLSGAGLFGVDKDYWIQDPDYTNASPAMQSSVTPTGMSATAGTVYFEMDDTNMADSTNEGIYVTLSATTSTTNRIFIQKRSTGTRMRIVSAATAQTTEIWDPARSGFPSGKNYFAISWSNNGSLYVYCNGAIVCKIDSTYVAPVGMDSIYIGKLNSGTANNLTTGTMTNLKQWNTQLTNAQLRFLTGNPQILTGVSYDSDAIMVGLLGQSNSVGQAVGSPVYTNSSAMFKITNAMVKSAYADPFDDPASAKISALTDATYLTGYAGYMADDLAGDTSRDVIVFPANLAGTDMATDAVPDWVSTQTGNRTTGTKINGPTAFLLGVINQIQMARQFAPLQALVFSQGESDAAGAAPQATYETNYSATIDFIRTAIGSNVLWIDATMPEYNADITPTEANYDAIIAAKAAVVASKSNCVTVDATDLAGIVGDEKHFSLASNAILGPRVSTAIQAVL